MSSLVSVEAELSVLGGMLIDAEAVPKATAIVDDTMLYHDAHRRLYRAMMRLVERGEVIDVVTLTEELKNSGEFEMMGGTPFLAQLLDAVPTAVNIDYHAKIVRDLADRRWSHPGLHGRPNEVRTGETDLGNAERLVAWHGPALRYVPAWRTWLVWDGRRWTKDATGEVQRRAKQTVRAIYHEAAEAKDMSRRAELAKWARQSEAEPRIRAMISLAQSEPGVAITPEQLDTDPWALNVLNGTLDLCTGELRLHTRKNLFMKLAPVEYDAAAECPTWLSFLDRIMGGNQDLVRFLQRAVGYSLTGETREQVFFLLYGTGANGKSTFLETISALAGDYGQTIDPSTLLAGTRSTARNDLARLFGIRFASGAEVEDGCRFAEVQIKQLTGGDAITARFLYQEHFEFRPCAKFFLAANHKPVVGGTDHAIWRRIRLIPFVTTIPEHERDKCLREKLEREFHGILAWAVRGCLDWQRDGLGTPDAVHSATEEYREEMDPLRDFLAERCEMHPGYWVTAKDLYAAYKGWAEGAGEVVLTQTALGKKLTESGITSDRGGPQGTKRRLGLRLLDTNSLNSCEQSAPEVSSNVSHGAVSVKTVRNCSNPSQRITEGEAEWADLQRRRAEGE